MSRDLSAQIAAARDHLDTRWSPDRQRSVWHGVKIAQQRRQRRQVAVASIAAVFCALLLVRWWVQPGDALEKSPAAANSIASAPAPKLLLQLADGSTVRATPGKSAELKPVLVTADAVEVRLVSGSAEFSVTPNSSRVFRVLAADVTISVLGTAFGVTLTAEDVAVAVKRGRVRVEGTAPARVLQAGERAVVPRLRSEAGTELALPELEPLEKAENPTPARTPTSWRILARKGDYESAYAQLEKSSHAGVRNTPEDLLLAADVARLSGHAEEATKPLRQLVSQHAGDPRASLAAFTLGRVLLDQLGRPIEAARAFAQARSLAPSGSLAQDSLAREVESWSRAGNLEQARTGARDYLNAYPNSSRARAVRRWAQFAD